VSGMSDVPGAPASHSAPVLEQATAREPRRVSTEELMGSAREVLIRHAGYDYRLHITRQGKLILTK
jgi:hemin uptake protein HemP